MGRRADKPLRKDEAVKMTSRSLNGGPRLPPQGLGQPMHVPGGRRRRRRRPFQGRNITPWLLILPVLVVHGFVVIVPSVLGLYYSLTEWSGIGRATYIGLENFRRLFTDDPAFIRALVNNLKWLLVFLTVPFGLALLAAALISQLKRGAYFYRIVLFIPFVLPSVIVAALWRNLLSPNIGIGSALKSMGIPGLDIAFLGRQDTALWAIAFIDNWHYWGFLTVLFLTAMQGVSRDLYDAAKVDGANRFRQFLHVTIPGIRPTLLFMLMMTAIWSFLVFDYVWILTQGGPAGSSEVMGTLVYKNAFLRFQAGYAAAQGITMSSLAGLIILLFIVLRRRGWDI
jgi:raffinose/stachyose/melibiose transport system permease protein